MDNTLLLEELWNGSNTVQEVRNRGWTDGPSYIGTGYKFEPDTVLKKTVLYIHWTDLSNKQPTGATSLQKVIAADDRGATFHVGFKTKNFYNNTNGDGAHCFRFIQNWTQQWGGMGAAPNQLNLEFGGSREPFVFNGQNGVKGDASRALYYAGGTYGSYAAYMNPGANRYLQDDVWYEVRAFMRPQTTIGQKTGSIIVEYKRVVDTQWIRVIEAHHVELTDMDGVITKFAIGPYRTPNTTDDRLYVGWVRVYAGDAVSNNFVKPFLSPTASTPTPTPTQTAAVVPSPTPTASPRRRFRS